MKKYVILLFFCLQVSLLIAQISGTSDNGIVFKNISVIGMLTNDVQKNQNVVIKSGKISSISDSKTIDYKNLKIVDGKGKYMMPSLADAHVHFPETEAEMERVMNLYLINGVAKLRSMRGEWKHIDWRAKYNNKSSIYPKLYLSPPPISRKYDFTTSQIEKFVKDSKEKGFDFLKILSIKDQTVFEEFDSICKKYDFPIAGHFPSNISDSLIFKSNYTSFEHLGGLTGNLEEVENRIQLIKERNIFICPTLSWYSVGSGRYTYDQLRNLAGMEYVPQATVRDWIEKTKEYREKIGNDAYKQEVANELKSLEEKYLVIKELHVQNIPMLLSPDSSSKYMVSGFDMVAEMELLKNADLSNYDILRMATTNFGTFFKEDYGTIEVGKKADFILLNANPLEDLNALKKIEGLYFNNQFLSSEKLEVMRMNLLKTAQN